MAILKALVDVTSDTEVEVVDIDSNDDEELSPQTAMAAAVDRGHSSVAATAVGQRPDAAGEVAAGPAPTGAGDVATSHATVAVANARPADARAEPSDDEHDEVRKVPLMEIPPLPNELCDLLGDLKVAPVPLVPLPEPGHGKRKQATGDTRPAFIVDTAKLPTTQPCVCCAVPVAASHVFIMSARLMCQDGCSWQGGEDRETTGHQGRQGQQGQTAGPAKFR